MEIRMKVIQGHATGKEFVYDSDEATNILVGREDPRSQAHWRLDPQDRFISRAHFSLEVRPPNCLLRDPQSMNGTFLIRGQVENRAEEILVEDGDQIRVGDTILAMTLIPFKSFDTQQQLRPLGDVKPPPSSMPKDQNLDPQKSTPELKPSIPVKSAAKEAAEMLCILCGDIMEKLPALDDAPLRDIDFMCPSCQRKVGAAREEEQRKAAAVKYTCAEKSCHRDVTDRADRDGRAAEMTEVAFYLCPSCAVKQTPPEKLEIGGYVLLKLLGRGGMGEVHKAWNTKTGRVAALKQMLPIANSDEKLLRRFHREMSIMQDIKHPNLVRFFEGGQFQGSPYFVSEFVTGGNLLQFVSADGEPVLAPDEAAQLIADTLVGLEFFHNRKDTRARKYVHRDIKPENILLEIKGGNRIPKLADFGLSKNYEENGGSTTQTGEAAGTILYMPPEQLVNFKYSKPPVDIYSLGTTLYYLLTGYLPLEFPPPWEIEKKQGQVRLKKSPTNMILYDPPIPVRNRRSDLPRNLCQVVDKSVVKDLNARYQTAEDFRSAILQAIR